MVSTGANAADEVAALGDGPGRARTYAKRYRLGVEDADPQGMVRLDGIARLIQDVALDMIHETGFLHDDPFWIVRRNVIDVIEPLTWPGDVDVERWCVASSSRWVGMRQRLHSTPIESPFNPHERGLGRVESASFVINVTRDGTPARISDSTTAAWSAGVTNTRLRWRSMNPAEPPAGSGITSDLYALRTTDFDFFDHLNNIAYWPAVHSLLLQYPELTARPYRAAIEYLKPVRLRPQLEVRHVFDGQSLVVWFLADDVVTTTASVRPLPG